MPTITVITPALTTGQDYCGHSHSTVKSAQKCANYLSRWAARMNKRGHNIPTDWKVAQC
jgi:hypothetical protein